MQDIVLTKYQIVFLGYKDEKCDLIRLKVIERVQSLGLAISSLMFLDETTFPSQYKKNAPTYCIYFSNVKGALPICDAVKTLLNDSKYILPIVSDLNNVRNEIPEQLSHINCISTKDDSYADRTVSFLLEGLHLLRSSRRLFISYRRSESSGVAIQLFEELERNGFDVFLDTHSIKPGEPFQEELWHRMVDTDVVVLLNTKDFLTSKWTTQELANANASSIGIVQLVWPNHHLESNAQISMPIQLQETDFINQDYASLESKLVVSAIPQIISAIESTRARTLAARQQSMIDEFRSIAQRLNVKSHVLAERIISIQNKDGTHTAVIPTVGIPKSDAFHQKDEFARSLKSTKFETVMILYNKTHIRDYWIKHIIWLDKYLPVKSLNVVDAEEWLEKL